MQYQNFNQQPKSSGFSFDFLKNCACVGRDREELSHSSRHGKNHLEAIPVDNLSSLSGNDWADIEEIVHQNQGYNLNTDENEFGFNMENYETLEPIDFDYLKTVTDDANDSKEGDQSFGSGISKGSKKISKNKPAELKSNNGSPTTPPKKGAKKGKRNPWQPHEDAKLLELVGKHGQSWSVLATLIEGRSGKQIRDRYLNILRPNIKKGDWTPQEDQHILALYYQFGHKWSKISSFVPGRTEGQVKNRFYAHIKKKILVNENPTEFTNNNISPHSLPNTAPSTAQNTARHFEFPGEVHQPQFEAPKNAAANVVKQSSDPTKFINYSANTNIQRGGSNEKFFNQPLQSPDSDHSTTTGGGNNIRDEASVDLALDRMAIFFEKKVSYTEMQNGYRAEDLMGVQENSALGKMERVDQLQKRRTMLEFLLQKTLNEMNRFDVQEGQNI